jgi:foldase protein PrsA
MLAQLIDERLVEQAADRYEVEVSEEDLDSRWQQVLRQAGGQEGLLARLQAQGMREEQARSQLRLSMLVDRLARGIITVTDPLAQAYYEEHADDWAQPEQVHARLMLFFSRANAEAVREALEAGGDFAGLATAFSQDPATQPQGGDMGFFSREDWAPEIVAQAFALEPGEVSKVFPGPEGYYLLQVQEKRPARVLELCEVREEIETRIVHERLPFAREVWMAARRRNALLDVPDPDLAAAVIDKLVDRSAPRFTLLP